MQCNGLVVSQSFTDGLLTIQNGVLSKRRECHFLLQFTDNTLTIQSGDITQCEQHAMQRSCGFTILHRRVANHSKWSPFKRREYKLCQFTDNTLTIQSGDITNVSNMQCNGIVVSQIFTDGLLTIQSVTCLTP